MPGRPPINAVIRPTINAAYNRTNGLAPATKAKAIASGTKAKATVSPANNSMLILELDNGNMLENKLLS